MNLLLNHHHETYFYQQEDAPRHATVLSNVCRVSCAEHFSNELSEVVYLHPDQGPLAKMTLLQTKKLRYARGNITNTTERTEV